MSNNPNKIIIHHSATKDTKSKSWDAIIRYHKSKGWKNVGYHYGIELVGDEYKVFKGRDESESGAHTIGQNSTSIGICCVGDYDEIEPPKEMLEVLIELINNIQLRLGKIPVHSHHTFADYKSCPGNKFPITWLIEHLGDTYSEWSKTVNKLADKGIISSPDYWIMSTSYNIEWFKKLINNFAKQDSFEADIKWMYSKGIISSPEYWIKYKSYSMENCKKMIEKISIYV